MDVNDYIKRELVHEIHTSERKSFRGCRRRWDWLYRGNYYPRVTAKALEFGIAYHKGMEILYRPETWQFDPEIKMQLAVQAFIEECETQKNSALDYQMAQGYSLQLSTEVEDDYNARVELGRNMLIYYCSKVAPVEDVNIWPVKVEVEFMVPIPNPETGDDVIWCTCSKCYQKWTAHVSNIQSAKSSEAARLQAQVNPGVFTNSSLTLQPLTPTDAGMPFTGLPVVYGGRLDLLVKDEHGNYWIVDWKTASQIKEDKEFLALDDQIGSYVWALRKLGLNIRGFIYHEQFKGYPQPPKENQRRREGRLFSVAKNQSTDYKTYMETVSRNDTEAWANGLYDEFLAYLLAEGIKYYDRRQVVKTDNEVAEIEYNIGLEALDMTDENIRLYPSAGRFGCNFCAFRQPCMEKNNRGDYQYALDTLFVRKEHYYKEIRLSTESQGGE